MIATTTTNPNGSVYRKAMSLNRAHGLYPRLTVNSFHVNNLQRALLRGTKLPPVIAWSKNDWVVDGFHRIAANLKQFGKDAEVEVEYRNYADVNEFLLESITLNAQHGNPLSAGDRAHCITICEQYKISIERIAASLFIPAEYVGDLKARKVAYNSVKQPIPIKHVAVHLAQTEMTELQIEGNRKSCGQSQIRIIQEVINLIEHDLLNTRNPQVMARLELLEEMMQEVLVKA